MIKRRRFYRIYIPYYYFTENSPECKNCADQYRCRRNRDDDKRISNASLSDAERVEIRLPEEKYGEDPYERYVMGVKK